MCDKIVGNINSKDKKEKLMNSDDKCVLIDNENESEQNFEDKR